MALVVIQDPLFLSLANLADDSHAALLFERPGAVEPLDPVLDCIFGFVVEDGGIAGRVAEVTNGVQGMALDFKGGVAAGGFDNGVHGHIERYCAELLCIYMAGGFIVWVYEAISSNGAACSAIGASFADPRRISMARIFQ